MFLSLKSSKLLSNSKSANSVQNVWLCRQDVLKACASVSLSDTVVKQTHWKRQNMSNNVHVGKDCRRKNTHSWTLNNEPKCWGTESYWLETILVPCFHQYCIPAVSYISDLEGVFVCSAIDSTCNLSKSNLSHNKPNKFQRDGTKH